jgi:hypothetical protein
VLKFLLLPHRHIATSHWHQFCLLFCLLLAADAHLTISSHESHIMSDTFPAAFQKKNVLSGFSPRVFPRPDYISFVDNLKMMAKEILYQSGFIGTCITLFVFPLYTILMALLREQLDPETSEKMLFTIAFNCTHLLAYIFWNSVFGFCDYFGYWQQFKLARKGYMQPNQALIVHTIVQAFVSQVIVNPLLTYYMLYDVFMTCGMSATDAPLPSLSDMFLVYCAANMFNSFFFYWAHRIFHHSSLYATFHKKHHEYRGTMGISAEHAGMTLASPRLALCCDLT